MREPLHVAEVNNAREWYNPLRGLTVQRVVDLLDEGERGKYDDLQKLNRMAEKRHPTLRALKQRRISALKKLDWNVKVPSSLPRGVTAAQADQQRVFLREQYEQIENLPEAIEHLALAQFRYYSHLEKHHQDNDSSLPVIRLQPVPQWHFLRDPDTRQWRYDAAARGDSTSSVPIEREHFIIREVDDALCEVALLCFLRRNLAKKNWTAFQEDYAVPSIFATLGENTPLDKVSEWLTIVRSVTNNSRGVLPPASKVTPFELGKLDGVQFENFIRAEDSDLVLAGTSGLLTMLTAKTGMNGSGQSGAHESTFDALALAEAMQVSALFQAQHDKPLLKQEFPSQPSVAYFQLVAEDRCEVDAFADRLLKMKHAGFDADAAEVSEKLGMNLTKSPSLPASQRSRPLANRNQSSAILLHNGSSLRKN